MMNRETFDAHLDTWRKLDTGRVNTELFIGFPPNGSYIYGTVTVSGDGARNSIADLLRLAEDSNGYMTVLTGSGPTRPIVSIAISCHELTSDEVLTIAAQGAA